MIRSSIEPVNAEAAEGTAFVPALPAAWDFQLADFPTADAWTAKSLAGIVPADAVAVALYFIFDAPGVGSQVAFRKAGNANDVNIVTKDTYAIATPWGLTGRGIVGVDAARAIEYWRDAAITVMNVVVVGWWV